MTNNTQKRYGLVFKSPGAPEGPTDVVGYGTFVPGVPVDLDTLGLDLTEAKAWAKVGPFELTELKDN